MIFNKAAESITGINMDQAIGRKIQEVVQDIKIADVLKTGKEENEQKTKNRHKCGVNKYNTYLYG